MEYCKNFSLSCALKAGFLRESATKKRVLTQLAYVLAYIHEQRFSHKAVKTSNIFLDKAQNLKLGDFADPTRVFLEKGEIYEKFSEKVLLFNSFSENLSRKRPICTCLARFYSKFGTISTRISKKPTF